MGSEELGANLFRITQTEAKLRREQPQGLETAGGIHYQVGQTVREAIAKNDGTMPEDLPTPEKSIAEIGREQLKKLKEKKEPPILDEMRCLYKSRKLLMLFYSLCRVQAMK